MSERSTRVTSTVTDVRVVPEYMVAVSISKIENLQIMRFISQLLTLIGGLVAGRGYPFEYFWLGLFLIILGYVIDYRKVQRIMKEWIETERRGTLLYTGDTVAEYQ